MMPTGSSSSDDCTNRGFLPKFLSLVLTFVDPFFFCGIKHPACFIKCGAWRLDDSACLLFRYYYYKGDNATVDDATMVLPDDEMRIRVSELDDAPPDVKEYLFALFEEQKRREPDKHVVPANLPSSNSNINIQRFLNNVQDFVSRLAPSPTRRSRGEREAPASPARQHFPLRIVSSCVFSYSVERRGLGGKSQIPMKVRLGTTSKDEVPIW